MSEKADPGRAAAEEPAILPPVDVLEDLAGITLCADLPGVPRERLGVHVEGDMLVIEGEIAVEVPKEMAATHIEVSLPRYRRVFTLSKELDAGRLAAELKHGVLIIRIPKAEHARPKRIAVEVG